VQGKIVSGTEHGVPMVSKASAESAAKKAGLSPNHVTKVVDAYGEAQIDALKRAIVAAALFALVGLWFAGDLPGAPLGATGAEAQAERGPPTEALSEA
jgi:hypothetical protein